MRKILFLILLAFFFNECKKKDQEPDLPAETQTGANTFGCRFNGQAWIPEANKPQDYNKYLIYYYDAGYGANGQIHIDALNFKKGGGISFDIFDTYSKIGVYSLTNKRRSVVSTAIGGGKCNYRSSFGGIDSLTYCQGSFNLKKLDLQKGIMSGTFEFVIYQSGCDTLKVTDGRFDFKI